METIKTSFDFEPLTKKEKALVFFSADWSTPCKMLEMTLEEIEIEHPEITFVKVDADRFRNIAKDYRVISVPVVCLFSNGSMVSEKNGIMRKEELLELIQQW
ncbi:MAG: thioredoxin family protein [Bacilli bacterium]|nr:thioredoxin family protein [Bacilli bacterium]